MHKLIMLVLLLFVPIRDHRSEYEALHWLLGAWQYTKGSMTFIENWSHAAPQLFTAHNVTLKNNDTITYEDVRLEIVNDTLCYHVKPKGQALTAFMLVQLTDNKAVFENFTNDFPQRITYHRTTADSLHAYIEGPSRGAWRQIDYYYARITKN